MGKVLHAIGAFSARRAWAVIVAWIILLVGVGAAAAAFQEPTDDTFSIPGTQSIETYEKYGEEFPGAGGATAQIVIAAPEGETLADPDATAAIGESVAALNATDDVTGATDPFQSMAVAPDGSVAYISVSYAEDAGQLPDGALDNATEAAQPMVDAGLQVEYAGTAFTPQAPTGGAGEVIGMLVAIVVLYITLRAVVAAALPFVTGIAAVGVGVGSVTALTGFVSLPSTATVLALMLGLAVGIDYSLFILARHRSQLLEGMENKESIAKAIGTSGAAVVFAGATVIVALVALFMANIPFLTAMGNAAAATVALAVIAALTLLPAVMSLAGNRILPKKMRAQVEASQNGTAEPVVAEPNTNRWARFVTNRPATVLIAGIVGLGIIAIPAADLRLGLPSAASQPEESTGYKAYELLADGFGPGFNGPILVLAETDDAADGPANVAAIGEDFAEIDNVAFVSPPVPNADGSAYLFQIIPTTAPDSAETEQVVHDIREVEASGDVTFGVTGETAIQIDVSEGISAALPGYLAVVIGLALILLLIVFRSILIPIKALLGFLLTLAATTGMLVAVFQWGWLSGLFGVEYTGPIVAFLPIIGIGITFGLSMDYEVFLVSRMREEHLSGRGAKESIIRGYSHTARVVVAAALIMGSVFFGFMLDDDVIIKSIGFALAFAVLFDAFVVRMTLVPAAMALMGNAAWWMPKWLQKIVPEIHLEGDPEDRKVIDVEPSKDDKVDAGSR
ncbi:MMPL family transporter [Demequina aurantiaca]|uniref:MMPL family transporter n=1 Tax=Demequina aurantiaca TaxID=676200 RepID=UPI0007829648|nr:MMPL family transporter [Demequina aurantiaca]